MASPSPIDRTLIPLALLCLPLNLASFIHRSLRHSDGRAAHCCRPAILPVLLLYLSAIPALSDVDPSPTKQQLSELEEMKIQVMKLESLLEEKNKFIDSRVLELEKSKKMIEEMDKKIVFLHETLNNAKVSCVGPSDLNENIRALDGEVKQLWDRSRRNNFNIHVSETKTWEAELKREEVASKVEKMQNVINEQWVQIQQLEQSLQMIKVMTSRVTKAIPSKGEKKRKSVSNPISWLRRSIAKHSYSKQVELPDSFFLGGSIPSLLKTTNKFKRILSAARNNHHELQDMVKQIMELNVYTAPLAHSEFIFFVASTVTILPLMAAWILLYPAFAG